MARFASVVLDADSTLAGIEGIDWLAERRSKAVAEESATLTAQAMEGGRPIDTIYAARLAKVRPSREMIAGLGAAYIRAVAPGAMDCVAALRAADVRVVIVSGGLRQALLPLARQLGVAAADVHAVDLLFDEAGEYARLADDQPLATQAGKEAMVRMLRLPAPVLAVGDGATDAAMRPAVDAFAAYVGFVRREAVVRVADHVLDSFAALTALVLP
ncbi:MAG: HAD-IB family phosphatase [Gemmatimonadota bacterium]|nr:HAD-IB family phosphatase [Gemmatimonadota bacterium]